MNRVQIRRTTIDDLREYMMIMQRMNINDNVDIILTNEPSPGKRSNT